MIVHVLDASSDLVKDITLFQRPSTPQQRDNPLMKKTILSLLCIATLAGCATFGQLEKGLNGLVGRSEREAFNALGYPNAKQEFGGDVVYVWGRSNSGTIFIPQTTSTTGYVGNRPVYATTTYNQPVAVNHNCTVKVITGANGIVKTWDYEGNLGGCRPYIQRLNAYFKKG